MSLLTKDIMKVAKVSESKAQEIENVMMETFDIRLSEVSQRELNATIRETVKFMNMNCTHPKGTQHTWECVR